MRSAVLTNSNAYWLQAKEEYQSAIASFESYESIEKARLHRKIAACLRKLGQREFAGQQWLLAHTLVKRLNHEPMLEKRKEETHLLLEEAYIEFSKEDWPKLQTKSEEIVRDYDKNQSQDIRWIVGSAYNLLAIALANPDYVILKSNLNPKKCWELAKEKLGGLGSSEAKRLLQDIEINLAVYLRDRGDCDLAIQKFEAIIDKHIVNSTEPIDKLSAERQIEVKYNLAVAYFDRYHLGDLEKVNRLSEEISKSEINSINLAYWVWALQLQLNVIIEQIRQVIDSTKLDLLKKAKDLYKELNRAKKSNEDKDWESNDEHAELHRLLTEMG